jgi:UDP-N-acetylmuramate dehydrogenase
MDQIINRLNEAGVGKVLTNEPLANHTTLKIGGPADILVIPENIDAIKKVINIVKEEDINWRAIGRGSNLLVDDEGIEGVVIKLSEGLDHLEIDGDEITVGGGYPVIKLATVISKQGLSGLEFAGGIPGSVGGAVFMNAGAHGSDVSKILKKAHILFADGTMEWLSCEEMEFSYRTSLLQKKPGVCLEAVFALTKGNKEEIVAQMQQNKDYRRKSQPWNFPCAGSIFRNPLPNYAGALIEEAGLKGHKIGGAQISEMHANFIVNAGDAKAKDVTDLIAHIKQTISDKFSVEMETEVEIIGGRGKKN